MSKKKSGSRNRRAQKRGIKNKKRKQKKQIEARRKAGQAEARARDWSASLRSLSVWEGQRGPAGLAGEEGAEQPIDWVIWVERPSGLVVGSGVVAAGDVGAMADVLHGAIDSPSYGAPRIPNRVCVADSHVAATLLDRFGEVLDVEIGPTPLADEAGASLAEYLAREAASTYLERHGIEAADAQQLFAAMAELAPHDALLFEAAEVRISFSGGGAANQVAKLWQAEPHRVLLTISPGEAHYRQRFMPRQEDRPRHEHSRPEVARGPGTLVVELVPVEDLAPRAQAEVREQGWPLSHGKRCPVLSRLALDGRELPVEVTDYHLAADVAAVLTELARERPEILGAEGAWAELSQRFGSAGLARIVCPGHVSDAEFERAVADGAMLSVDLPTDVYEAAAGLDMLTPLAREVLDRATALRGGEIHRIPATADEHRHMAQLLIALARKRGGPDALVVAANRFVEAAFPKMIEVADDSEGLSPLLRRKAAWRPPRRRAAKRAKKRAKKTAAREARSLYELKITLQGVRPPIWRRIEVRSDIMLDGLHRAIQDAMGWDDAHLHEFECGGTRYGPVVDDFDPFGEGPENERVTRLSDVLTKPKSSLRYVYDFGDNWQHTVTLEKTTPLPSDRRAPRPRCIGGRRACPPEDCGGPPGYDELLQALRDPRHPEHESYAEWGGPDFDPEAY